MIGAKNIARQGEGRRDSTVGRGAKRLDRRERGENYLFFRHTQNVNTGLDVLSCLNPCTCSGSSDKGGVEVFTGRRE